MSDLLKRPDRINSVNVKEENVLDVIINRTSNDPWIDFLNKLEKKVSDIFRIYKLGELFVSSFGLIKEEDTDEISFSSNKLADLYLKSFPSGTNQMFIEKKEYDCNNCKKFISKIGNMVYIDDDYKIKTIWDIPDLMYPFNEVCKVLDEELKKHVIETVFVVNRKYKDINVRENVGEKTIDDKIKLFKFRHMYCEISDKFLTDDVGYIYHNHDADYKKLKRFLEDIPVETFLLVRDIVYDDLYRGDIYKPLIEKYISEDNQSGILVEYKKYKDEYENSELFQNTFLNKQVSKYTSAVINLKNTPIGEMMYNIKNGDSVDVAIEKYIKMVDPSNYMRVTSEIKSKNELKIAKDKIEQLGIKDSVYRRHMSRLDVGRIIPTQNIKYMDREFYKSSELDTFSDFFDGLEKSIVSKVKNFDNAPSKSMEEFFNKILPKCRKVEIYLDNTLDNYFMSVIGPMYSESKNMFKWNNPVCCIYNEGLSGISKYINKRVKEEGGKLNELINVSLSWFNKDDYDAHMKVTPKDERPEHIYFGKKRKHNMELDVDMNASHPSTNPVENITFVGNDIGDIKRGKYRYYVHNFRFRSDGEVVEPHFLVLFTYFGKTLLLRYDRRLKGEERINTIEFKINDPATGISDIKILDKDLISVNQFDSKELKTSRNVWNLKTGEFHTVELAMLSPNYWGDVKVGEKQYLFIIKDCKNPNEIPGFLNEYLIRDLRDNRKVLERLKDKFIVKPEDKQLSGLGFTETIDKEVVFKVTYGSGLTNVYKVYTK
jgi:hypothetical protein